MSVKSSSHDSDVSISGRKYSLRPLARTIDESTLEGAFRVYMATTDMNQEGLKPGDLISLRNDSTSAIGIAVVTRAVDGGGGGNLKGRTNPVIRMSEWLREKYSFELKDRYHLEKWKHKFQPIEKIVVTNVTDSEPVSIDSVKFWTRVSLASLEGIGVGGTFDVTPKWGAEKEKRQRFLVEEIEPPQREKGTMIPYSLMLNSDIIYKNLISRPGSATNNSNGVLEFNFNGLIGMDRQLEELQRCLPTPESFLHGDNTVPILLHGSARVGKTTVLQKIKKASWARVFIIDELTNGGTDSKIRSRLRDLFKEATESTPSLITIDNIHRIAPKGDGNIFAWDLAELIEQSKSEGVQVIATAKRARDVQADLRRSFEEIIELPLPNMEARYRVLTEIAQNCDNRVLGRTADKAHAFSAHDLNLLWRKAVRLAKSRIDRERKESGRPKSSASEDSGPPRPRVLEEDLEEALKVVHPESMNEIYVEVPKVYWSDIGGSATTKAYLQEIVESMGKDKFSPSYFHVNQSKGVLLYGPPGCSKTMTAKALATESGLNFLSVKGPELISKWVGETEDNIRDVFQKARENSPSMIFFDEFDALAKRQSGHESLSPVKALLAELDGVIELHGVLVLAATNNPEAIDPALLRPGRFSRLVYTGPPDLEARIEILKMHTVKRHLKESVDLLRIAERTENWSGAEIVELCDLAAMKAETDFKADHALNKMTEKHFEAAFSDVHPQISEAMLEGYKNWSVKGIGIMAK